MSNESNFPFEDHRFWDIRRLKIADPDNRHMELTLQKKMAHSVTKSLVEKNI